MHCLEQISYCSAGKMLFRVIFLERKRPWMRRHHSTPIAYLLRPLALRCAHPTNMETNVDRFTGRVAAYELYRDRYAPEVVLPPLREWCGLTAEWVVADVGAGTGMLAEVFLANGNAVFAVEPNAEMPAMCRRLHADDKKLEVVEGTAEATRLAAGSCDMVVVGRAMHWFDLPASLKEFRRILRPGGWVITIAYGRSENGAEENEALETLLRTVTKQHTSSHAGYTVYRHVDQYFQGGFHRLEIHEQKGYTWEQLRGLVLSLSHSPLPDDPRFAWFVRHLRALFDRLAQDGQFRLALRYWINAGRFAEESLLLSTR